MGVIWLEIAVIIILLVQINLCYTYKTYVKYILRETQEIIFEKYRKLLIQKHYSENTI